MSLSLIRAISARKNHFSFGFYNRYTFHLQDHIIAPNCCKFSSLGFTSRARHGNRNLIPNLNLSCLLRLTNGFCSVSIVDNEDISCERFNVELEDKKPKVVYKKPIDFTKIDVNLLPTVIIIGRPNVGKSALYNRLIRRREALVYNTPDDHVTRDIREGIAKLGDLRFNVLDSAGIETEVSSGTILGRTTAMTANVLARTQFVRAGLHPLDLEVVKWLRKHAPQIKPVIVMNKSESIGSSLDEVASEALALGFGEPIAISAETGLGMTTLYEVLRPLLEDYTVEMLNVLYLEEDVQNDENLSDEIDESKLPLQLAIVGKPNVGKSTLLNALLEEERVLVGPEARLTRDAVRVQFEFQGRTVYMVDTAGWLERTERDKGPASLSIMQSRKSLMRAHVIVLVLDAEEIIKAKCSMTHSEVVIARRAVEEGRGLVVIVNKMDCLRGKQNSEMYKKIKEAVPIEVQTVIPQITVTDTYKRWCSRLSTSSVYLACFARPRNGFASVSFSRKVESNGCNGDASSEKLVGSTLLLLGPGRGNSSNTLLLGPGRSTKATGADEKWDELLTRASSRRLEIKLKKKCDNSYYFSEKLISFMNWLQWLKCKLMHLFTSEEETPKSYDTASASRALARLLGPLIIAAFLYCAKEIVSKLWDIHKQKKIQLALDDRFNEHEQRVLEIAAVQLDDKVEEIREDYEELRTRLNEELDGLWKAVILLSRGKK